MCFIFTERPVKNVSVCVVPYPLAVHLAFLKLALVAAEVWPLHDASTLELVFYELADVHFSTIGEIVFSLPVKLALKEVAVVGGALEFKLALASFLAMFEVTLVLDGIKVPKFEAQAVLEIVSPIAFVETTFVIAKDSFAMCFSVLPLTLVDVAVCMGHTSHTIKEPVFSLTLIFGSIPKNNSSKTSPLYFGRRFFIPVTDILSSLANILH